MLIKVWDTEDVTRGCIATLKGHTDVVREIKLEMYYKDSHNTCGWKSFLVTLHKSLHGTIVCNSSYRRLREPKHSRIPSLL